jgi:hypothetical protein
MQTSTLRIALLGMLPLLLAAAPPATHKYPLAGHGTLTLDVPSGWKEEVSDDQEHPPSITLNDPSGSVELLIIPFWPDEGDTEFTTPPRVLNSVEGFAARAQRDAVEHPLVVKAFPSPGGKGYFFSATFRAPKEGEYLSKVQGAVPVGPIVAAFIVGTHKKSPAAVEAALTIVRSAKHLK